MDAQSVRAFVAYGNQVLGATHAQAVPAEIQQRFRWYLEQWNETASQEAEVRWSHELSPDDLKYLLHAFHRLTVDVQEAAQRSEVPAFPDAASAFYRMLVRALLDAVAVESNGCAAWAADLGTFWPGVEQADRWPEPVAVSAR